MKNRGCNRALPKVLATGAAARTARAADFARAVALSGVGGGVAEASLLVGIRTTAVARPRTGVIE
jgi:hypothetical protein